MVNNSYIEQLKRVIKSLIGFLTNIYKIHTQKHVKDIGNFL